MKIPKQALLPCLAALAFSSLAQAQYVYYSQNTFTSGSINNSIWSTVGSITATSGIGLTNPSNVGGALLSTQTVPGSSTDYEVEEFLAIGGSGDSFMIYLGATPGSILQGGNTGTYNALVLSKVTCTGGSCTATLYLAQSDPQLGAVTTSYTYDVVNHLPGVSMPRSGYTQTRTFNYHVSGTVVTAFLQSATNPETGTVNSTYNSNNTLASKTDAKGQKFAYAYDSYNRLTTIKAGATLLRTFIYYTNTLDNTGFSQNTLGRLAAVQYPANAEAIQFNGVQLRGSGNRWGGTTREKAPAGKPSAEGWIVSYNNGGSVLSTTYPNSGPSYTYTFDGMYRPATLGSVVSNVSYGPSNELLGMTYNGGITERRTHHSLLQLTSVTSGQVNMQYNFLAAPSNNGQACLATDLITGEQVVYSYDTLKRLAPIRSPVCQALTVRQRRAPPPGARRIRLMATGICGTRSARAERRRSRSAIMTLTTGSGSLGRSTTPMEICWQAAWGFCCTPMTPRTA